MYDILQIIKGKCMYPICTYSACTVLLSKSVTVIRKTVNIVLTMTAAGVNRPDCIMCGLVDVKTVI